jgi:hypothetical protein
MMAFADRVVMVSRLGSLRQLRWQTQFVERFGNHCGQVLIALVEPVEGFIEMSHGQTVPDTGNPA